MEQEAFILYGNNSEMGNLDKLNQKLKEGWKVVSTSPMGGNGNGYAVAAVVILERERGDNNGN